MIILDLHSINTSDKVDLFRRLLDSMPEMVRKLEVERAYRIEEGKPVYLIETPDGRTFRASSPKQIAKVIEMITGKNPNLSNIYKILRGTSKTIYGLTIKKHKENYENGTID